MSPRFRSGGGRRGPDIWGYVSTDFGLGVFLTAACICMS